MSLYTRLKMTSKQNREIGFNEIWRELMMAMLFNDIYTEITAENRKSFSNEVRVRVLDQKLVGSVNVIAEIKDDGLTKTEKHEIFFQYGNGRGKQFDPTNDVEYLELYIPISGNADRILLNISLNASIAHIKLSSSIAAYASTKVWPLLMILKMHDQK